MIFIGASYGGSEALATLLGRLPADLPAAIAVVLHRHRDSDGLLAPYLQTSTPLRVAEAEDKRTAEPGHVYLAPPDYHLTIDHGALSLTTDEPVNWARPSVDVLFESAAEWCRREAVGVVLSGSGVDGAAGARAIEARGGAVLVQDPATATGPWMPGAAIAATRAPRILSLGDIAAAIVAFAFSPGGRAARPGAWERGPAARG